MTISDNKKRIADELKQKLEQSLRGGQQKPTGSTPPLTNLPIQGRERSVFDGRLIQRSINEEPKRQEKIKTEAGGKEKNKQRHIIQEIFDSEKKYLNPITQFEEGFLNQIDREKFSEFY